MPMYSDTILTLDQQRRPRLFPAGGQKLADTKTRSDDGALIFCGISLALGIIGLVALTTGHADLTAVMF